MTDEKTLGTIDAHAAFVFAERWKDAKDEQQQAQEFWREFFFDVVGIKDLRAEGIEFEKKVISNKNEKATNRIDVFWKDTVLIEHKSAGKDLNLAEEQARDYIVSLPPALRPPVIIVSDFARIRIVEYLVNKSYEFPLTELPDNLSRIEAIASKKSQNVSLVQVEADQKASRLMANLYRQLEKNGYEGHEASVFMMRILFCMFADDTRMWKINIFQDFLNDTSPDGKDVGARLQSLFETLDIPEANRPKIMDSFIQPFPYVNGGLFAEKLPSFYFTKEMRDALLDACAYDWSSINPTIFGSLLQSAKDKESRRSGGEHYTTEEAIDKCLYPLILDEIQERLVDVWDNTAKLKELQKELGQYQIFDPACGSGNFLITAYKRLRRIELDIIVRLRQLQGDSGNSFLFQADDDIQVKLGQLHGIEYEEWSSQIATVALFLTDHQLNLELETILGIAPRRFPLSKSANIIHGNSLQLDWAEICPMNDKTLIVGNPPFLGSNWQSAEQKADTARIWAGINGSGVIDYVANWHLLAARHTKGTKARIAFVSTNSITQGEQPQILWSALYPLGVGIDFAHRTFVWESDASGKASVHCVIIGFSHNPKPKQLSLWEYPLNQVGEPKLLKASNINAYLLDAPNVLIAPSRKPLQATTQEMVNGSKPTDGGFLSNITPEEAKAIEATDPIASKYLRRIVGAQEMLNGKERYCLWLQNADPSDIKSSKELSSRVASVKAMRLESTDKATIADAARPSEFQKIRQPKTQYLGVPRVSSGNREYVPMMLIEPEVICSDAIQTIPSSDQATFAVLQSKLFAVWNVAVSGRLKSDFRISAEITYNNFPFPEFDKDTTDAISKTGQAIIEAREKFPNSSLADLYDSISMPPDLRKAHQLNDKAILKACGMKDSATDAEILSYLFDRYAKLIELSS